MIKLRAQQILIESPKEGGEYWIRVVVQRIEKDGDIINTVSQWDSFHKRLADVAMEAVPFSVSDQSSCTVYELSTAITRLTIKWLVERYNATVTAEGDVII